MSENNGVSQILMWFEFLILFTMQMMGIASKAKIIEGLLSRTSRHLVLTKLDSKIYPAVLMLYDSIFLEFELWVMWR